MAVATGTLAAVGMGLGALGSLGGAVGQDRANSRNYAAQQAYQQYLQNLGQGMMTQGASPFAQQIQQFMQGIQPFSPQQGFTYNPAMLGDAPMVDAPTMQAALLGAAPTVAAGQVGGPSGINLPTITPGLVDAARVAMPSGGEQFNMGQDALLQMMRRQYAPVVDAGFQKNLEDLYGGATFDASGVLSTLAPIDQRMLEEQAVALRGAAGSLGQRFGTDIAQNERQLRETAMQNIGARNAQLMQGAWESGQNRRLQALSIGQQQNQFLSQFPLQAAALQMQAAQGLQAGGMDFARLIQNAQLAQAGYQQQAGLANQGASLQAQQANAANALQAALQTQSLGMQGQQFNVAQALQAALANQQLQGQYGLQGAQFQQQAGLANQDAIMRALLSNQGLTGQYALANQGAANQAGQFNAGQLQNMAQFNFGAGMQQNQFGLQGILAAAQAQQAQQALNAQLFGALAGVGVPQAAGPSWPGALGDASSYMMLPWLLQQTRPQQTRPQGGS